MKTSPQNGICIFIALALFAAERAACSLTLAPCCLSYINTQQLYNPIHNFNVHNILSLNGIYVYVGCMKSFHLVNFIETHILQVLHNEFHDIYVTSLGSTVQYIQPILEEMEKQVKAGRTNDIVTSSLSHHACIQLSQCSSILLCFHS